MEKWSEKELEFLKANYSKIPNFDIAVKLFEINNYKHDRSIPAIKRKASQLDLCSQENMKNGRIKVQNYWNNFDKKYNYKKNEIKKELATFSKDFFDKQDKQEKAFKKEFL